MAEVSMKLEAVLGRTTNTKTVLLSGTPTATNDTITFDSSTLLNVLGGGYNKVLAAWAQDGSTGMPKSISGNGSTIFTTRGWTSGDNKWFVFIVLENDTGWKI